MIQPADLRQFANLPPEVPEALLAEHIGIAERELARVTGATGPATGREDDWAEALKVRALASALPWLNTFALDGAAQVGRLEGSVTYRFLTADEVAAKTVSLLDRFNDLAAILTPQSPSKTDLSGLGFFAI